MADGFEVHTGTPVRRDEGKEMARRRWQGGKQEEEGGEEEEEDDDDAIDHVVAVAVSVVVVAVPVSVVSVVLVADGSLTSTIRLNPT